ncbi:cell division protein ZapC domain-containing protein [Celerinatantimonas yamalensis]|uniref:Cell division protein ZapC domain-containing protein n=1 Tax=Celerinatantimonas yamalensis TaxID=559956 RepID=A0ABW9G4V3_9GAMM
MLLHPNKTWRWFYDPTLQRMTLLLGEQMQFVSELDGRKMSLAAQRAGEFTCDQTQRYLQLLDVLQGFNWPDPIKVQTALNALALAEYHKPVMPQSWFFEQGSQMQPCEFAEVVSLKTQCGLARFIVLDVEPTTALCMCLEKELVLGAAKTMHCFEVIKVMRDRLVEDEPPKVFAQAV